MSKLLALSKHIGGIWIMCYGVCPKCLYLRDLTKHHIYPRRFFGVWKNSPILHLCRACHDLIETLLPANEKLRKQDYLQITREFLLEV